MAKLHSDGRGSSGSTRPLRDEHPDWAELDADEIESTIVDLYEEGHGQAEVGMILRDQYGVPDVKAATGKKVGEILEDHDVAPEMPEELRNLIQRALNLREHLAEHPTDTANRRGLQLLESKIRRVARYHKEQGNIPHDWVYSPSEAQLMFE